tara:strand:- start:437 stop:613 length:177 start_codon:yes stop_codon:yes gene_type:complete
VKDFFQSLGELWEMFKKLKIKFFDRNWKPIEIKQPVLTVYDRYGKICNTYSQKQGQLW